MGGIVPWHRPRPIRVSAVLGTMTAVTTPEHDPGAPSATASELPPATAAVDTNDCAALRHARGPAADCPACFDEAAADVPADLLRVVLSSDAGTAAHALDTVIRCAVDDEGDLAVFPFVLPVARFAAALLDDPRTGHPHPAARPVPARRCAPHSWRWGTTDSQPEEAAIG
ncbi:hypothetical protein ACU686_11930 [Yinghuangia aomiensis]